MGKDCGEPGRKHKKMWPVALETDGAKVFASMYALFSGVVFIMASGVLLSPVFHHVLYKFHLERKD